MWEATARLTIAPAAGTSLVPINGAYRAGDYHGRVGGLAGDLHGSVRRRVVQGAEITAVRRLGRYEHRSDLDLSSTVLSNAYRWPAVGPFATEDLVRGLQDRRCELITYQDPYELGRAALG